jgi:hypothetical protein
MSQATLTFQLPEEEAEFSYAANGLKWRIIVSDILDNIRLDVKYSQETTEEQKKVLENMRSFIYKRMGEDGLILDG